MKNVHLVVFRVFSTFLQLVRDVIRDDVMEEPVGLEGTEMVEYNTELDGETLLITDPPLQDGVGLTASLDSEASLHFFFPSGNQGSCLHRPSSSVVPDCQAHQLCLGR